MLPDTTMDGTADMNPATRRPTAAPATDGVTPTTTQAMQYIKDDEM